MVELKSCFEIGDQVLRPPEESITAILYHDHCVHGRRTVVHSAFHVLTRHSASHNIILL